MLQIPEVCSSRNLTSGRNNGERNKLLEGYSAILKISNGAPIQDGWLTDPTTTEIITARCGLTMFWLLFVISLQQFVRWKFCNMFTEKITRLLIYLRYMLCSWTWSTFALCVVICYLIALHRGVATMAYSDNLRSLYLLPVPNCLSLIHQKV